MTFPSNSDAAHRRILVVGHTGRPDAVTAMVDVVRALVRAGVTPVVERDAVSTLSADGGLDPTAAGRLVTFDANSAENVEICIVLGGDGTILRAAELVRGAGVPIIGVNLGHVGFLAESERDSVETVVARVLHRDYVVEQRIALELCVERPGEPPVSMWALNDAAFEKADRGRMIEIMIAVDGEPLESFGCDGVVLSTPTGSTAYAFSAGGPVVWPGVDALLAVPIAAHALFARPIVVSVESVITVDLSAESDAEALIWCDGRREVRVTAGSRVTARVSPDRVQLARLHDAPFTRRLVEKFRLPVSGWRQSPAAGATTSETHGGVTAPETAQFGGRA